MLAFVLRRHNLIDWSDLPDQPDARVLPGLPQSGRPYSRRSIELGEVRLDRRPVPISLQRFQAGEAEPVWLFSPLTVERTPEIFAQIRPACWDDGFPWKSAWTTWEGTRRVNCWRQPFCW